MEESATPGKHDKRMAQALALLKEINGAWLSLDVGHRLRNEAHDEIWRIEEELR